MKLLVMMGPPRCGLHAIASLVCMCTDMFTCSFAETHHKLERLLTRMGALVRLHATPGQSPLPLSSSKLKLTHDEVVRIFSSYVFEAGKNGHTTEKYIVIPERLLFPFVGSITEFMPNDVSWLWVARSPEKVEHSCIVTKWMPRLVKGEWMSYVRDLQKNADIYHESLSSWKEILSDPIFRGDVSQLSSILGELGCQWNGQEIGGIYANRK
jgi:hypothetical protein